MNYNKIRRLQKTNKVSNREIAPEIGMSDTGFGKMLENQTCDVETIERIAKYFQVSVSFFFDEKDLVGYPNDEKFNVANEPCNKCEVLQAKLDGANALVESQKQTIAALQGEHKKETPDASIASAV